MENLHAHPTAVVVWSVVIGICFLLMVVRLFQTSRWLREYRRDLMARVRSLRIHRMLGRLGVSVPRYTKNTNAPDIERQLSNCERCDSVKLCDEYLDGKVDADPEGFCRNYRELRKCRPGTR